MELKIQTAKLLDSSLIEMAKARGMSLESCVGQLVEAAVASFRGERIRPSLVAGSSSEIFKPIKKKPGRRRPLTTDQLEKAACLVREGVPVADVAKRFGKSTNRMRDALRQNGFIVHVQIPGPRGRKRGQAISYGSAQRLA